jgi:hypothetical protein
MMKWVARCRRGHVEHFLYAELYLEALARNLEARQ